MLTAALLASCLAGDVIVDAKVPVDVSLGGVRMAQMWQPGVLRLPIQAGKAELTLVTFGTPRTFELDVPPNADVHVLVGATGITTDHIDRPVAALTGDATVEFRSSGRQHVTVVVDRKRHRLAPGATLELTIPIGDHELYVTSDDTTVVWARGTLELPSPERVVVQVAEGVMPEVSADSGAYRPAQ